MFSSRVLEDVSVGSRSGGGSEATGSIAHRSRLMKERAKERSAL